VFTLAGRSPYDGVAFRVTAPFESCDTLSTEVPSSWSEEACEALAELCFAQDCVPARRVAVPEDDVPRFLWRHGPDPADDPDAPRAPEDSATQVFDRIAGALAYQGWKSGAFDAADDAAAFHDELRHMLCRQMVAFEPTVWSDAGLRWAYGIGAAPDGWAVDYRTGAARLAIADDIPPHGAAVVSGPDDARDRDAFAAWREESSALARGLETAIDVSRIAAVGALEPALRIGETAANEARGRGTGCSGRTLALDCRRADAADFVALRARQMHRAALAAAGAHLATRHLETLVQVSSGRGRRGYDPARNPALRLAMIAAREAGIPEDWIERTLRLARQGRALPDLPPSPEAAGDGADPLTRHLVRVTDPAMDGSDAALLDAIALAAWLAPGTGAMFASAAEGWHGCAADGPIAAAACDGGYAFLPGTVCGRASVNLLAFRRPDATFAVAEFAHAVRLAAIALDLSLAMTAQPTRALAEGTWRYRPIGITLANLGPWLVSSGQGYDSDGGRALAAAAVALAGAEATATSAEMAAELGAFPRFAANREPMLRAIANRVRAAGGERFFYDGLARPPAALDHAACPDPALAEAALAAWRRAHDLAEAHGLRNAHLTLIAPQRTSERIMGCDAFGVDPDPGLVKYVRLPGGGFRKAVSRNLALGLAALGYQAGEIEDILDHVAGRGSLDGAPAINRARLKAHGFTEAALQSIDGALESALDIRHAFNRWTLGDEFCTRVLGLSQTQLDDYGFDMLKALGFAESEIAAANAWCCGAMTVAGAPHLHPSDVAVFDTARPHGPDGRAVAARAVIRMMAAVEPYLTGAVGKRIALPAEASVADCAETFAEAFRLGLKGIALERESVPIPIAASDADGRRAADAPRIGHAAERAGQNSGRDRFLVIDGGERPAQAPVQAPQPTASASASALALVPSQPPQAIAIAMTARTLAQGALAVEAEHHPETCRTEPTASCPSCGNFALLRTEAGVKCGICGAVRGCRV
jgi:ribonucleoside-diphosphate reductase alpha chain